ncbi:MAG TPA: tautomerase family protein [Fibrobacteria bacterium]|nr:tautomerase family protein [Fibrobacteria bacterium]
MAQVKIYGLRESLAATRAQWSGLIHAALVETLGLPEDKKFQRFIPLDPGDFIHPADRTDAYTIVEISLFEGRSPGAIKSLLKRIMADAQTALGLSAHDIEITVFESPRHCWGIRGKTGDELALAYKVDV